MEGFSCIPPVIIAGEFAFPLPDIDPNNKNWNLFMSVLSPPNPLLLGRLMVNMQPIIPIKNGHQVEKSKARNKTSQQCILQSQVL